MNPINTKTKKIGFPRKSDLVLFGGLRRLEEEEAGITMVEMNTCILTFFIMCLFSCTYYMLLVLLVQSHHHPATY